MRVVLLLLCAVMLCGVGSQQLPDATPRPITSYDLVAKTNPAAFGNSTTYTLFRIVGKNSQQLWSLTLPEHYVHHWISPNGTVWVLSSYQRIHDGGKVWCRSVEADQLVEFNLGVAGYGRTADQKETLAPSNLDLDASVAKAIGDMRVDQLDLKLKSGGLIRCTLPRMEDMSTEPVLRYFPEGQKAEDLLSDSAGQSTAEVTFPVRSPRRLAIWNFRNARQRYLLEEINDVPQLATQVVNSERALESMPDYVVRTPAGRLLWFDFPINSPPATMRVTDMVGKNIHEVDLVKLGRFGSNEAAKQSLLFRDVAVMRGSQPVPLAGADWSSYGQPETLQMLDRSGRTFLVTIKPGSDDQFTIDAVASLGLDKKPSLEPDMTGAKITREEVKSSDSNQYRVRMREYQSATGKTDQMTLIGTIQDPVEGPKEVELWSHPMYSWPVAVRVSDSGRVLEVQGGKWPSGKLQGNDFALLTTYELSGKTMAGLDLISRGWFKSIADVEQNLHLDTMALTMEDKKTEYNEQGIPLVEWSKEHFAIHGTDGKVYRIRVEGNPHPGMPQMLYFDK